MHLGDPVTRYSRRWTGYVILTAGCGRTRFQLIYVIHNVPQVYSNAEHRFMALEIGSTLIPSCKVLQQIPKLNNHNP